MKSYKLYLLRIQNHQQKSEANPETFTRKTFSRNTRIIQHLTVKDYGAGEMVRLKAPSTFQTTQVQIPAPA